MLISIEPPITHCNVEVLPCSLQNSGLVSPDILKASRTLAVDRTHNEWMRSHLIAWHPFPANMGYWGNGGLKLCQRRRRWTNINQHSINIFSVLGPNFPTNTRRVSNFVLMVGQRRRRWASIKQAMDQYIINFLGPHFPTSTPYIRGFIQPTLDNDPTLNQHLSSTKPHLANIWRRSSMDLRHTEVNNAALSCYIYICHVIDTSEQMISLFLS